MKLRQWLVYGTCGAAVFCASPANADQSKSIELNNQGIMALSSGNFNEAIEKLESAERADPTYPLARQNLAIVHSNIGLSLRSDPKRALKHLHLAAYLDPWNATTQQNVNGIIAAMGKDPKSFADRAMLGLESKYEGDAESAIVEFEAALKLKQDLKISKIYTELCERTLKTGKTLYSIFDDEQFGEKESSFYADLSTKDQDDYFAAYMNELSKAIKSNWSPPENVPANQVVIQFQISRTGCISDVHAHPSSASNSEIEYLMATVSKTSPFLFPLPRGRASVDVQFKFGYNGVAKKVASSTDNSTNEQPTDAGIYQVCDCLPSVSEAQMKMAIVEPPAKTVDADAAKYPVPYVPRPR